MTVGVSTRKMVSTVLVSERSQTPNIHHVIKSFFMLSFCLQVRTLFVSGLPVDIKPRELYLLFRPFKVSNMVYLETEMMYFQLFPRCWK